LKVRSQEISRWDAIRGFVPMMPDYVTSDPGGDPGFDPGYDRRFSHFPYVLGCHGPFRILVSRVTAPEN
jgi:hypothetical protein